VLKEPPATKKATNSMEMEKLGQEDKILLGTLLSTYLSDFSQLPSPADML
jgi:hypothetical protein